MLVGAWKCGRAQGPMLHQLELGIIKTMGFAVRLEFLLPGA